jgi:hypothetical protein
LNPGPALSVFGPSVDILLDRYSAAAGGG